MFAYSCKQRIEWNNIYLNVFVVNIFVTRIWIQKIFNHTVNQLQNYSTFHKSQIFSIQNNFIIMKLLKIVVVLVQQKK